MGHLYLENVSKFFVRRLYALGSISIRDCVEALAKAKEGVHGNTGISHERYMLGIAVGEVVKFLSQADVCPCCKRDMGPVIETVELSEREREILQAWIHGEGDAEFEWDEDNPEAEGTILDNIRWRYTKGWRAKYVSGELPLLDNLTL